MNYRNIQEITLDVCTDTTWFLYDFDILYAFRNIFRFNMVQKASPNDYDRVLSSILT